MNLVAAFPAKLDLALKALSFSRVSLAHDLGVDKSLVGRWLSGAVHPTEHNLARLAALVALRQPDFRLADWYRPLAAFGAMFGLSLPDPVPAELPPFSLLGPIEARAKEETTRRGAVYEGFWRTTRASLLMPDQIFHDYGMIRCGDGGLLEVIMHGSGLSFEGWMLPVEGNLFVFLRDQTGRTPMSLVFRGVNLPRAMVLDGLLMLAALDAGRTLGAIPILLERVGDLGSDRAADDARCSGLHQQAPAPLDPVSPEEVRARLYRDCGPLAAAGGGTGFLSIGAQDSLSRGTTTGGLSG